MNSVILGAGQIGPRLGKRLAARGDSVRLVRRGSGRVPGFQTVSADLRDAKAAEAAMHGADVVYHCVTPPYTEWSTELIPMTEGILAGVAKTGAHLIVLENLYVYGRAGTMREETPWAPVSKKGELRARACELMQKSGVPVTIGRASDFFGPHVPLAAIFGERFMQRVRAGKSAEVLGDPEQPHSYSYVEDVADALVLLGTDARAKGHTWHLPVQPAESSRAVIGRAARALGRDIPVSSVPTWVLKTMGLFQPIMREIAEMTYQWEIPFVLDDSRFRSTFGVAATPWDSAWRATWAA